MEQINSNKRKRSDDEMTVLGDPIKIVLLGNSAIGKSTLFHKITQLTNKNYKFPKTRTKDKKTGLWSKVKDAYKKGAAGAKSQIINT